MVPSDHPCLLLSSVWHLGLPMSLTKPSLSLFPSLLLPWLSLLHIHTDPVHHSQAALPTWIYLALLSKSLLLSHSFPDTLYSAPLSSIIGTHSPVSTSLCFPYSMTTGCRIQKEKGRKLTGSGCCQSFCTLLPLMMFYLYYKGLCSRRPT